MRVVLWVALLWLCASAVGAAQPPAAALEAGYGALTFESRFDDAEIDYRNDQWRQHRWFVGRFFGWEATPRDFFARAPDGALTILTGGKRPNFEIATATARKQSPKKWVGKAFGGGGYFEAELKFDPAPVTAADRKGWPSFWAMSVEHMAEIPQEQWAGQEERYSHYIEVDILEALHKRADRYGSYMHDWFGVWRKTCGEKQFCKHSFAAQEPAVMLPKGASFDVYNTYGFLWVPAKKGAQGWGQFYFNGQPAGKKVVWESFEGQPPSMEKQPWTFGVLDRQHIVLILGTGQGQPMTVRRVSVWQASDAENWEQGK